MSRSRRWRSCALNYMFIFTTTERSRQVFRQQSRQQPSSLRQDPVSVKLTSSSDLPSSQQASQPGPLLAPAVPRSAAKLPVMHLPCDVHRLPPLPPPTLLPLLTHTLLLTPSACLTGEVTQGSPTGGAGSVLLELSFVFPLGHVYRRPRWSRSAPVHELQTCFQWSQGD